ncbi:hypothetical protein [Lewinella sp. W8]|uniref:hypothetical protein n=1 Tax=Lewinella sp. W8 TaxID=2528208 RepID=UPI001067C7FB|nr:hypothetical protein [Lewinella sp. W8]MTB53973.1 hypothetical protein [Lewinella sp. W8]
MRWKKILFSTAASLFNFLNGALIGALLGAPAAEGQMLAAGAIVFFYMIIGAVFGLAFTLFLAWRWDATRMRNMAIGAGVLALIMVGITYKLAEQRRAERQQRQQESLEGRVSPKPAAPAKDTLELTEKTQPAVERQAGPGLAVEGLGLVRVPFSAQGIRLPFFATSAVRTTTAVDSLVYDNDRGNFSLRYAPPYLMPFYQKMDYQTLLFRFSGISPQAVQLEVNEGQGRKLWVPREAVEVKFWPDFLAGVAVVHALDPANNPVRRRALPHAPTADFPEGTQWMPRVVEGDWIGVLPLMPDGSRPEIPVWLRWRKDGQLLVGWDYFM